MAASYLGGVEIVMVPRAILVVATRNEGRRCCGSGVGCGDGRHSRLLLRRGNQRAWCLRARCSLSVPTASAGSSHRVGFKVLR